MWAHGNDLSNNTVRLAMDSLFPDHPGLPPNHSTFEDNLIYDTNEDSLTYVRAGNCGRIRPRGTATEPFRAMPWRKWGASVSSA